MSDDTNGGARKKETQIPTMCNGEKINEDEKQPGLSVGTGYYGANVEIPASPPKYVTMDELLKASDGFTNMALAHEIAVNKDFRIEKNQLPENSLQKQVEDVLQKAFWDALESELTEDPPNCRLAIGMINNIKGNLLKLLLPQHTKIHQQISDILDIDLIKQQAEAGTIDLQMYAQYVISVMGKLCAPVRDEKIASLTKITNIIDLFKGIFETLNLLKLDMANFTIKHMRPQIIANSVEYEKKKFADILKVDRFGLVKTKEWLERHLSAGKEISDIKKKAAAIYNDGFLELLEWDEQNEFPETMILDKVRILELKPRFETLTLAGAILLITQAQSGPDLCSIEDFKQKIKNDTLILLADLKFGRDLDIKPVLAAISEKLKFELVSASRQYGIGGAELKVSILGPQISELADPNHRIRNLLKQRVKEFLLGMLSSQSQDPMKIPSGLSSLQDKVTQLASSFMQIVSRNKAVYEEYYIDIVQEFSKV